jgi:hypothetical protein
MPVFGGTMLVVSNNGNRDDARYDFPHDDTQAVGASTHLRELVDSAAISPA